MKCAWNALMGLLPQGYKAIVDKLSRETLQELRLRRGRPPLLVKQDGKAELPFTVSAEDIQFIINAACRYSPWTAESAASGYITAPGGHRIGLCGQAVEHKGLITDIRQVTSLCIRVARDFPGIGEKAPKRGNLIILGPPGSGKTTLLRDIIRNRSQSSQGSVAVVDERGELFPDYGGNYSFFPGAGTDVLSGCKKSSGIIMLVRAMCPRTIAVDEITSQEDSNAVLEAIGCGVDIVATAHAGSVRDFMSRPTYAQLIKHRIFQNILLMRPDKSWQEERVYYDT